MAHFRSFSRVLDKLNVSPTTPVAVAVSGGCDSLALTLLAKKIFNRVIGITVDHRLRKESKDEAIKVGELVRSLGVEHHTVDLDWGEEDTPRKGKVQTVARDKRFTALLETCKELKIGTLLVGHHQDDQNETFIMRFAMGSGIEGLGSMYPVTYWPGYPATRIVRPLLEWKKSDIVEVCRSEGMEWVEDPSNSSCEYMRNIIRSKLADHPDLCSGLPQLISSCSDARNIIHERVNDASLSLPTLDSKLGCLYVNMNKLKSLPRFVATRVLVVLAQYITGTKLSCHYEKLKLLFNQLPLKKSFSLGAQGTLVPLNQQTLCFVRGLPQRDAQTSTPLHIGQPLLWDNRWTITLTPRVTLNKPRLYKVRHLRQTDWGLARQGLRKVRKYRLPHEKIRGGFPVITDEFGRVVAVPHLQMINGSYQLNCSVEFNPRYKLEELLKNHSPKD